MSGLDTSKIGGARQKRAAREQGRKLAAIDRMLDGFMGMFHRQNAVISHLVSRIEVLEEKAKIKDVPEMPEFPAIAINAQSADRSETVQEAPESIPKEETDILDQDGLTSEQESSDENEK